MVNKGSEELPFPDDVALDWRNVQASNC
jgi:hypothetical protein